MLRTTSAAPSYHSSPQLEANDPFADPPEPLNRVDTPNVNAWRVPLADVEGDPRLPPANDLTWEQKDRFVRLNGRARHNGKLDAAAAGTGVAAMGALMAGISVATMGVAVPLMVVAGALMGSSIAGHAAGGALLTRPRPEGLRKHLLSDFDRSISPLQSKKIVEDLKARGVYGGGRVRRFNNTDTLRWTLQNSAALPEDKRPLVDALVRFHQEDIAWRDGVQTCFNLVEKDLKLCGKPKKKGPVDPAQKARYTGLKTLKRDLLQLRAAAPSQRQIARSWISDQQSKYRDSDHGSAYDRLLVSLKRQAAV